MTIHFEKSKPTLGYDTIANDQSVHETIRKAIAVCDGDESIVLSLESAMEIVREWDAVKGS